MKTFYELSFRDTAASLEEFSKKILSYSTENWSSGIKGFPPTKWMYFDYTGDAVDHASVCLSEMTTDNDLELRVTNIVPLEKTQLTVDEYNEILQQFYNDIIEPCIGKVASVSIHKMFDNKFDPLTYISPKALAKLEAFCNGANKTTGASHPCDQERWFDFICQTVDDNMMFDYATLAEFLQDEDYWGPKDPDFKGAMGLYAWDKMQADKLASEYENACELLQYYRNRKAHN